MTNYRKIIIEYSKQQKGIVIRADADGLRYLSQVFLRIIGKSGPAAHWHLMEKMGTLTPGSINTKICFDPEASADQTKIGKIRLEYIRQPEEIVMVADADGLRYLSGVCELLMAKGHAAQWHLRENIDYFEPASVDLGIYFIGKN